MIMYFSITSVRDRARAELRQSELARALQVAELRLLKSQLNPHFLFNSLNSVRALIADDPTGAQKAVTQLARTLRYTLTAGQEEVVSLERELEIVADYLELESLRLGERLHIERAIAVDARVAHIPVMLLQTVVENAIKHGIAELPQGGVLRLSADVRDGALIVEVPPQSPKKPPASRRMTGNGAQSQGFMIGSSISSSRPVATSACP
jgi:LytS/YehU family sensor histidine kinase